MAARDRTHSGERGKSGSRSRPDVADGAVAAPIVGIRDLRADVAALVRRAGAGEHVIISVAGRPIAHLGPIGTYDGQVRMEDLVAAGRVVPARRAGTYSPPAPVPMWHTSRIDRLLEEVR